MDEITSRLNTLHIANKTSFSDKLEYYNKNIESILIIQKLYKKHAKKHAVKSVLQPSEYELFDINSIDELPSDYPEEFKQFCNENDIKLPKLSSSTGKAWCLMAVNKYKYFNREVCEQIAAKFNIKSNDIIQQFNKVNQKGIKSNSDLYDKGKSYIVYPYCLSNKHKMRKNFRFDGTEEEKNIEIDKIKSNIKTDYIDIPNNLWQLGHKNPGSTDNSTKNLVLQPPIQGKYRDNYIFIDTLTKFPTPNKLETMIRKNEVEFTPEQILYYKQIFDKLATSM
jgi:hypothetical protein